MSGESTIPDLVEVARRWYEAASRRDLDAMMSVFAPGAILKLMAMGTSFEGVTAIREFVADWLSSYEESPSRPRRF